MSEEEEREVSTHNIEEDDQVFLANWLLGDMGLEYVMGLTT